MSFPPRDFGRAFRYRRREPMIVEVSPARRPRTELCFRFEPLQDEDPFDSLRRLRAAVFLTGVAIESAKVIESDREWVAPPDMSSVVSVCGPKGALAPEVLTPEEVARPIEAAPERDHGGRGEHLSPPQYQTAKPFISSVRQ
jgi:hypothetical protein